MLLLGPEYPTDIDTLATYINQSSLPELVSRFLYDQINPDCPIGSMDVDLDECPSYAGRINVFHSAVARFYTPSDLCGAGGMHRETIRSTPSWQRGPARRDTVFVETDATNRGMLGMTISRVHLFFSLKFEGVTYPCALIHWFKDVGPDDATRMWVVKPEYSNGHPRQPRSPNLAVIHIDCIACAAHLMPNFGSSFLPNDCPDFTASLDIFHSYFVSKYADHHTHEFLL